MDDYSEPEESLTGPIAAKDRAASALAKGSASVDLCGHTSVHAAGATVAGNPRIQWDVIEDKELLAVPRPTPKAIGTPSLRPAASQCSQLAELQLTRSRVFLQAGPIGSGG